MTVARAHRDVMKVHQVLGNDQQALQAVRCSLAVRAIRITVCTRARRSCCAQTHLAVFFTLYPIVALSLSLSLSLSLAQAEEHLKLMRGRGSQRDIGRAVSSVAMLRAQCGINGDIDWNKVQRSSVSHIFATFLSFLLNIVDRRWYCATEFWASHSYEIFSLFSHSYEIFSLFSFLSAMSHPICTLLCLRYVCNSDVSVTRRLANRVRHSLLRLRVFFSCFSRVFLVTISHESLAFLCFSPRAEIIRGCHRAPLGTGCDW
jgi:hypothetical protein